MGLRLFEVHGLHNVTMTQIAQAAGISRSTLLRYFPTKADLLWDRMPRELEKLRQDLAALDTAEDPAVVVGRALATMLIYDDDDIDLLRTQVRIIASCERDADSLPPRLSEIREVILEALETRLGWDRDGLDAQLLARTATSAGWTAMLVWVRTDEQRPERLQAEAQRRIVEGLARHSPPTPANP